ncbi:MAG TPA: DoxX family protein [Pyrinomonadaceae bacterium]|jgi:putative oxidoreductase
MFRKLIATAPTWFTLPVRLALGIIFIAHGAQKVFGMWGGPGLKAITAMPPPLGLHPSWVWMGAAAFSELIGGALVLLGLLTRLGALFISFVMIVAIVGVHWGLFFAPNGMEYPLALLSMTLALLIAGGGQASLDMGLMKSRRR